MLLSELQPHKVAYGRKMDLYSKSMPILVNQFTTGFGIFSLVSAACFWPPVFTSFNQSSRIAFIDYILGNRLQMCTETIVTCKQKDLSNKSFHHHVCHNFRISFSCITAYESEIDQLCLIVLTCCKQTVLIHIPLSGLQWLLNCFRVGEQDDIQVGPFYTAQNIYGFVMTQNSIL